MERTVATHVYDVLVDKLREELTKELGKPELRDDEWLPQLEEDLETLTENVEWVVDRLKSGGTI